MLKLLVIVSLLIPVKSFSAVCAPFEGTYDCKGVSGSVKIKVTQKNSNEFTLDLGEGPFSFVANGKMQVEKTQEADITGEFRALAKCEDNSVSYDSVLKITKGANKHQIEAFYQLDKISEGNVNLTLRLANYMNGQETIRPLAGTVPCKKVEL